MRADRSVASHRPWRRGSRQAGPGNPGRRTWRLSLSATRHSQVRLASRRAAAAVEACGRSIGGKSGLSRRFRLGIARVFLGWAKAARRQARARVSPRQNRASCETGLSWGMLLIVQISSFPGLGRMFVARPRGGLWLFRVLGSAGSSRHTANRCGGRSACTTESRRSKQVHACECWCSPSCRDEADRTYLG